MSKLKDFSLNYNNLAVGIVIMWGHITKQNNSSVAQ